MAFSRVGVRRLRTGAIPLVFCALAYGQTAPRPSQAPQPVSEGSGYRLDVRTGLVIEDVSVTDKHGYPVSGLPQSAFHLWDNGVVQQVQSFAEHTAAAAETAPAQGLPPGTFSNATLYGNQGSTVAMLVDNYSMAVPDQMYLRLQMHRFVDTMAPATRVAIFRTGRSGAPVLIQALTQDHAALKSAIDSIVPGMLRPIDSAYGNAVAQLQNLADLLRPVPGRKALLWFSGAFPLYLDPDICNVVGAPVPTIEEAEKVVDCNALNDVRREAFRAMQQARIAVYPIDVRGVLVLPGVTRPQIEGGGPAAGVANAPMYGPRRLTSETLKVAGQYDVMDMLADATGGHAFYSNNALAEAMQTAVNLAAQSYTLSYRPEPAVADGKWHKVRMEVDGPYTVHYRTGYYAAEAARPARPVLRASGFGEARASVPAVERPGEAGDQTRPIVFQAHVQPTEGGKTAAKPSLFRVEYTIPSAELAFSAGADGTQHARVRVFALAYNSQGDVLGSAVDVLETRFTPTQMSVAARIGTPALQLVNAAKGAEFLLLAVEDLQTHGIGTLQVPIHALQSQAAR